MPGIMQHPTLANPVLATVQRFERRAPWRAFAPVICLGLIGLAVVLLVGAWRPTIGAALGTFLAASVSVLAAYVSYRVKQEDDSRVDERRRIVEQKGVAEALIAEIEDNKRASEAVHSYETIADVWWKMTVEPAYLPFLVEDEGGDQVYGALIDRLLLLPYSVVRPVVRYCAADTTLNESIAAWRSPDSRALCDPKNAASIKAGRPRQKRFVMWTLLSICDVYRVELPDARTAPAAAASGPQPGATAGGGDGRAGDDPEFLALLND